jgi:hypothetical protein
MINFMSSSAEPLPDGSLMESMPFLNSLGQYGANVALAVLSTSVIAYIFFQLKVLPKSVARIVSKIFFYPTIPITALMRFGNYWTSVDETVRKSIV